MTIQQTRETRLIDLVRELSAESIRYFVELSLSDDLPPHEKPLLGRFVRLGEEVILLGSTMSYGPKHETGQRSHINHWDLVNFAKCGPDHELTERITDTAPQKGNYLSNQWPIVDAGLSTIRLDSNGNPEVLVLYGLSDYGRPLGRVRFATGRLAQQAVGAEQPIRVELEQPSNEMVCGGDARKG
jgi:hypothetical protein